MTGDPGPQADPRPLRLVPPADADAPPSATFPIVAIGASAGGLEAASEFLRHLPAHPGLAFVLVQHLDPTHASGLVDLLGRVTSLAVTEATDDVAVEVDHVYVIPPGKAMVMSGGRLRTSPRATSPEPQRLIDQFMQSLSEDCPGRCAGVILSGTGTDGTRGLAMIKAAGGLTFAQDASAAHAGMPLAAVAAGCVDFVLPPSGIASELVLLGVHPFLAAPVTAGSDPPADAVALDRLFRALNETGHVDFSHYKQGTVRRRIERRMIVNHVQRLEDYAALVESSPAEAEALHDDILIHVTSFFRDPEAFAALATHVFPAIVEGRPEDKPIRIWVPGCSTGEEVYSLAIALIEYLGDRSSRVPVKLFGTDVSEACVRRARAGHYGPHVASDVSPERLRRFFVETSGGWQISKAVRELCVFARQDATRDPPFSRLDLISCRNVLIYLGPVLQARVLPIFHYALQEGGFLLLGRAEAVGSARDLFETIDARHGIHARKSVPSRLRFEGLGERRPLPGAAPGGVAAVRPAAGPDIVREADRLVLARSPAGVVVDGSMTILQFRGDTGPYLAPAAGPPSHDLFKMAREGLLPELRAAVEEARRCDAPVSRRKVRVRDEDGWRHVDLEVLPVRLPRSAERAFVVQFEPGAGSAPAAGRKAKKGAAGTGAPAGRVAALERELAATKEHLQSIIDDQQASTEVVETANEEILSSNEELQSTNEELQTAKEELQATNEELLTVNEELQHRNREATQLGDDLTNLLTSASIPIVMLGRDLRIRRFTPTAAGVLDLVPADTGRPIADVAPRLRVPDLEQLLAQVVGTLVPCEREVQDLGGRWHLLSIRPYRTQDDKIDGAVLSLRDIDAIKRSERLLAAARDHAESIVMSVPRPLVVLDAELRVRTANRAFEESFRVAPAVVLGQPLLALDGGRWNLPGLSERLTEVVREGTSFEGVTVEADLSALGLRTLVLDGRPVAGTEAGERQVLLAIEDVTEKLRDQEERRLLERKAQDTQRLESLGILAGGIAHDFNNILTGILGHANLAAEDAPPGSPLRHHLDRIDEAVHRAAGLCGQMLAYSGRGHFVVARCDLSTVVRDAARLVDLAVGAKTALRFDLALGLPPVLADATQVQQVVMNLVTNAAEALGETGGAVTISTGMLHADRAYLEKALHSPSIPEGEYVYLEVKDEGCGMSAETQSRMFDPFFTTKFTGRGLGLAAVLGIVRGHRGALMIESEPGRGSTFRFLLPCMPASQAAPDLAPAAPTELRPHGTILVVDDEDAVRTVLARLLESFGFNVVEASSGLEAVSLLRSHQDGFRLVLLDMTMPGMGGKETFDELRRLRPDQRVVLMSGYTEKESLKRFEAEGVAGFLKKPFGRSQLMSRLEDLIGEG